MAEHGPETLSGPVLIAEDEALGAMFLVDIVEELGLAVAGPAGSREAALRAAARTPPSVAIVDVNLDRAGAGIELAKELCESYGTRIIFLSGYADLAANQAVRAVNPVTILQKPCPPDELTAALRAAASSGS